MLYSLSSHGVIHAYVCCHSDEVLVVFTLSSLDLIKNMIKYILNILIVIIT